MKHLFILGSLNMDLTIYASRFPKPGETLKGHSFRSGPGGKGLNQAVAAARLGAQVSFLGAIGKDGFGQTMKELLKDEGVDVHFVLTKEEVSSGIAMITVAQSENAIALDCGANEQIRVEDVVSFLASAQPGDIFLSQGENNLAALSAALHLAHEKGMLVLLNPALANREMLPLLPLVDLLVPNESEAALLSGSSLPDDWARLLAVPTLVVTLGKEGFLYSSPLEHYQEKPRPVNAIDTTGAGDAFCGSFAAFLSFEIPCKTALSLSNFYAGLTTTRRGTSAAMFTRKQFIQALKEQGDPALMKSLLSLKD